MPPNVDSFLLCVRLKQLPKVPTFKQAVMQQQQATDEEAEASRKGQCLAERIAVQSPVVSITRSYNLVDDEEGEDWQHAPDDWWQQKPDEPDEQADATHDTVNLEGESV